MNPYQFGFSLNVTPWIVEESCRGARTVRPDHRERPDQGPEKPTRQPRLAALLRRLRAGALRQAVLEVS